MLMTSAPPVAIGLFDQNCKAYTRMDNPKLYKTSQSSEFFNLKVFWLWILNATVHSVVLYWMPMAAFKDGIVWASGRNGDYLVLGNIVYSCVVITVCLKAGLTLDSWNWICHLSIWGSIGIWFIFLVVYSYFWPVGIMLAANMAGMPELVFTTPIFWLCILMVPLVALVPDISYQALKITMKPSETDKVRLAEKVNASRVPSEGSSLLGRVNRFLTTKAPDRRMRPEMELRASSGYAFSQEESGAQEKVTRAYDTTKSRKKRSGRLS